MPRVSDIVPRAELIKALKGLRTWLRKNRSIAPRRSQRSVPWGADVRLRVFGDSWELLSGSADYDQDHRGAWGSGFVESGASDDQLSRTADELLREADDALAEQEDW